MLLFSMKCETKLQNPFEVLPGEERLMEELGLLVEDCFKALFLHFRTTNPHKLIILGWVYGSHLTHELGCMDIC